MGESNVPPEGGGVPREGDGSEVHPYQKLLDNPWMLWLLGFLVPTLSYTVWGLIDLLSMAKGTLP